MKKKILYFMPDNPVSGKAGNITRLKQLLTYFNNTKELEVSFVSVSDWGLWQETDQQIFKEIYPQIRLHLLRKKYKEDFLKYLFLYKIPYLVQNRKTIDLTSFILRKEFARLANSVRYDFVIISYASWGNVIKGIKDPKPFLICDTHDFITAQSKKKRKKLGRLFQTEMDILNKFNELWTYSVEEEYLFGQFTDAKVTLMPVSFPENFAKHSGQFRYDVIFVGSDNPHNIAGIHWFLKHVLPLLKGINVHIIGKVGNSIKENYPGVKIHGLVDDLEEFYTHARLAICPMLSGTGIKIKVLEALSYGIPVVTNRRGIDGLKNKAENGCLVYDDAQGFADSILSLIHNDEFYEKIRNEGKAYFKKNHHPLLEQKILDQLFLNQV